ncbi:MAG: aminotransferase class IV [Nitrospirae bacterium]|nr:aminotransferase class IV [Nitrospirota bacterium]
MWVCINDQFVPQEQALISVYDHGFLYGDGVYETLRVYDGTPFLLDRHLDRLQQSCTLIRLSLPNPSMGWAETIRELLHKNSLTTAMIRITLSRGPGKLGLDPALCPTPTTVIMANPLSPLPVHLREHGVRIGIVHIQKNAASAISPRIKSLNFLNNILAKQEAIQEDLFDGVMLNQDGQLTECTTSNFFFVRSNTLCTPSKESGILEGITRETIIELAKTLGMDIHEALFLPQDLIEVEECFLTNSGFEILPVCEIRDYFTHPPCPGPWTQKLHAAFQNLVKTQGGA